MNTSPLFINYGMKWLGLILSYRASFQLSEVKSRSLEDDSSAQDKRYRELEIDLQDTRADAQKARADLQKARADRQLLNSLLIKSRTEHNERLEHEICKDFAASAMTFSGLCIEAFRPRPFRTVRVAIHRSNRPIGSVIGPPSRRSFEVIEGGERYLACYLMHSSLTLIFGSVVKWRNTRENLNCVWKVMTRV